MHLLNPQITNDQRKKIFAIAKQVGLSNPELHDCIFTWVGVRSLGNTCSGKNAHKIIECLNKIIVSKTNYGKSGNQASDRQLEEINRLRDSLGWNDARIAGFAKHTLKKNLFDDLTVSEASKLITGLRKYLSTKKLPMEN